MVKNPNNALWQQYEDYAEKRGELVAHVLQQFTSLPGKTILDYGCGTGGISRALAMHSAEVTAFDIDENRLHVLRQSLQQKKLPIDTVTDISEFKAASFDVILLVDVIEHVPHPQKTIADCYRLLKQDGLLYLTTPNKFSPLNILCDPHFSLPFVGLLSRRNVRRIVATWLKWQPKDRIDFPELLSLHSLCRLYQQNKFTWQFVNRPATCYAVRHPHSLWNRQWHLKVVRHPFGNRLLRFLAGRISEKKGFFNSFINPTWFIIGSNSKK